MELPEEIVDDVRTRLRRVAGQVQGIERMLDEGRDCRDVVTQVTAATKALEQAGFRIVAAGSGLLPDRARAGRGGRLPTGRDREDVPEVGLSPAACRGARSAAGQTGGVSDAFGPRVPSYPPPAPPPRLPPAPEPAQPVIRWGIGDAFYGILLYLAAGVVVSVVLLVTGAIDIDSSTADVDVELSVPLVGLSLAAGWVGFVGWPIVASYRKGQRSLAKDFGLAIRWIDVAWGLLGGLGALLLSAGAGLLWTVASGDDPPSNAGFLPEAPGVLGGIALFLLVAVATPIVEELFFRGLVLRAIGRRWTLPIGIVGSSAVFGLFHFTGGSSIPHGFFIVAVTGLYGAVFALLVSRAHGRLGPRHRGPRRGERRGGRAPAQWRLQRGVGPRTPPSAGTAASIADLGA